MSTEKTNIQAARFALLARLDEKIFHTDDLANIWLIKSKNNLYTTLKRYVQAGLLHRIYKGFYSILPPQKLDPVLMGAKAIHNFCYLSTETVLYHNDYISQPPNAITFIGFKSQKFTIGKQRYTCRQMNHQFLMNNLEIEERNNIQIATPARAIADMLYFNPKFHFDKKIDWKKIKKLQKKIGYPLTPQRYVAANPK